VKSGSDVASVYDRCSLHLCKVETFLVNKMADEAG
jgi:hypothetical protein